MEVTKALSEYIVNLRFSDLRKMWWREPSSVFWTGWG